MKMLILTTAMVMLLVGCDSAFVGVDEPQDQVNVSRKVDNSDETQATTRYWKTWGRFKGGGTEATGIAGTGHGMDSFGTVHIICWQNPSWCYRIEANGDYVDVRGGLISGSSTTHSIEQESIVP